MKEKYAFVIMVKEKWWREFCRLSREGKEVQAYVGGPRAPPTNASLLIFYVSKPVGEIGGYAEFIERKVGKAEELWKEHGGESVLSSAEQYFQFVKDKPKVSFIRFKNLREAANPIPLDNARLLLGVKRLARGGFYIDKETAEKMIALME
jgi:predicted transcriptional regulator